MYRAWAVSAALALLLGLGGWRWMSRFWQPPSDQAQARQRLELLGIHTVSKWKLFEAIAAADVSVVDLLLRAGVSADCVDDADRPALEVAVAAERPAIVQSLIEHGAELDVNGWRALWNSSDCETADNNQAVAAERAPGRDCAAARRVLLEALAAADSTDTGTGHSPFTASVALNDLELVRGFLRTGADPNAQVAHRQGDWRPVLHFAVSVEMVQLLAQNGAKCDAVDHVGCTALAQALNRPELLRAHLEVGADPDAVCQGRSALMDATDRGLTEPVRVLLAAGADPNLRDGKGRTALHRACLRHQVEVVTALIEHKADLNAQDLWGRTPLMEVPRGPAGVEITRMLVEAGADVTVRDNQGETAYSLRRFDEAAAEILRGGRSVDR